MKRYSPSWLGACLGIGLFLACSSGDNLHRVITITTIDVPGVAVGDRRAGASGATTGGGATGGGGATNGGVEETASGGVPVIDSRQAGEVNSGGASVAAGGEGGAPPGHGNAGDAGSGPECKNDLDCGLADDVLCRRAVCENGQCGVVIDQNQVPIPASPCMLGTCNKLGEAGQEPGLPGVACSGEGGEKLCDAYGRCVECLRSSDCESGKVCSAARRCISAACSDVDCGGLCPPCANGKHCGADTDCTSGACDSVSRTCVPNECHDQAQNGDETDTDCGGSTCPRCAVGQLCIESSDCATDACDALKLQCVALQCGDHRRDGHETDVDCGGPTCKACAAGQACESSLDCQSGHQCANKVCL